MKHLLVKDKFRRFSYKKKELDILLLKYILFNLRFSTHIREHVSLLLSKATFVINARTKIRNRCILTNRARFLFCMYKVSRLEFKRLAVVGQLNGVYQGSW